MTMRLAHIFAMRRNMGASSLYRNSAMNHPRTAQRTHSTRIYWSAIFEERDAAHINRQRRRYGARAAAHAFLRRVGKHRGRERRRDHHRIVRRRNTDVER